MTDAKSRKTLRSASCQHIRIARLKTRSLEIFHGPEGILMHRAWLRKLSNKEIGLSVFLLKIVLVDNKNTKTLPLQRNNDSKTLGRKKLVHRPDA
jgi:hypothetical protein